MKKSELKTGMVVETRRGELATVFIDNVYGEDAIVFNEGNWTGLDSFDEETLEWFPETVKDRNNRTPHQRSVDIVKVLQPDLPTGFFKQDSKFGPMKVLWAEIVEDRSSWVRKWITNKDWPGVLIYVTGIREDNHYFGYGFTLNDDCEDVEWFNQNVAGGNINADFLQLATEDQIIQGLIKEAHKRYNVPCRVKYLDSNNIDLLKGNELTYYDGVLYASWDGGDDEDSYQNIIFKDGKWAPLMNYVEGDIVRVIKGGFGANGANGRVGIVLDKKTEIRNGISTDNGLVIQIGTQIWGLNDNYEVETIKLKILC